MERSHSNLAPPTASAAGGTTESTTRSGAAHRTPRPSPGRRFTPESFHANLDEETRLRLGIQRRAQHNLRRHIQRAAVRFSVLVAADVGVFWLIRTLLRAVRDHALFGAGVAGDVAAVVPRGALSGFQFVVALVVCLSVTGNYGPADRRRDPRSLFLAAALAVALPLWMTMWTRGVAAALIEYALTTAMVWAAITAERFTIERVVALVRAPEHDAVRAIFVGPADECRRAAQKPVFTSGKNYRTLGFVDVASPPASDALGPSADLVRLIHEAHAEAVVICGHFRTPLFNSVVDAALSAGCELVSIPRTVGIAGVRPSFVWRNGEALVTLTAPALKGQQLILKRIADVVGATFGLVALSPVLALVAALIKLDSRGPVFFRQQRVGLGGRFFGVVKFRTMDVDAEQRLEEIRPRSIYGDPRMFKVVGDPRVTRVGRFLRRTSLDELPQLWNVLRGDMSLVGPRPPLLSEVALYQLHHYARFDVRPGMTGPWQVNGRNEITDFEQIVRLETTYIREWSLWKDLAILARTVPVVLKMRGAH